MPKKKKKKIKPGSGGSPYDDMTGYGKDWPPPVNEQQLPKA